MSVSCPSHYHAKIFYLDRDGREVASDTSTCTHPPPVTTTSANRISLIYNLFLISLRIFPEDLTRVVVEVRLRDGDSQATSYCCSRSVWCSNSVSRIVRLLLSVMFIGERPNKWITNYNAELGRATTSKRDGAVWEGVKSDTCRLWRSEQLHYLDVVFFTPKVVEPSWVFLWKKFDYRLMLLLRAKQSVSRNRSKAVFDVPGSAVRLTGSVSEWVCVCFMWEQLCDKKVCLRCCGGA